MNVLDILFPKTCVNCGKWGSYLCANCFVKLSYEVRPICVECNKASIDGRTHPGCLRKNSIKGVFSATVYNPVLKKLLAAYKYPPYVKDLEKVLIDLVYESLIQQERFMKLLEKEVLFVPVPLFIKKYRERGYNQAEELAKLLGKRLDIFVVNALIRTKETKTQVNLTKEEREQNVKHAFASVPSYKAKVVGKTVVLVDDVLTTGATMSACSGVLYKAGAKDVWGITMAHGK